MLDLIWVGGSSMISLRLCLGLVWVVVMILVKISARFDYICDCADSSFYY
jgi:hypothetical protein